MAYYAFLDSNMIVTEVVAGNDEGSGIDWEQYYMAQRGQICKRTSYNTRGGIYYDPQTNQPAADQSKAFRKNYAGIGYTYDHERDAFIPPKPDGEGWQIDENTCTWVIDN